MNYTEFATRKIEEAKALLAAGTEVILHEDQSRLKAGGITGYHARQIDGMTVDAKIHADTMLQSAAIEIERKGRRKIGKKEYEWDDEAIVAYRRIMDYRCEIEDDEDE